MFGCLIMLFAREDHIKSLRKVHTVKVKTGVRGMAANKGSTAIRFNYEDSSFMFLNCHLTSGQKEVQDRFDDLQQCYTETTQTFLAAANESQRQ